MAQSQPPSQLARNLLDLPDEVLLALVCCLAADRDLRSLFSTARAHSTLRQLSASALTSIHTAATQQQVASLQLYLARHGRHVKNLQVDRVPGAQALLYDIPPGLQLDRLFVAGLRLQLLRLGSSAGVLPLGISIKQLEISYCDVGDYQPYAALAQALPQLPQLERIKYASVDIAFPGHVLSDLKQLTSLDVVYQPADTLEFVHLAPGLRDLRASLKWTDSTSKLSALHHLTSLQLMPYSDSAEFSPAGLTNKGHLQRMEIRGATAAGGPAGVAALLFQLQQMTQLTHLAMVPWAHADTARLVYCCPNLQELTVRTLGHTTPQVLLPLRGLTALTELEAGELDVVGLAAAAGLTQLRQLRVWQHKTATEAGLLQLTQLRQLTALVSSRCCSSVKVFGNKGCDGVPVWRQVLLHCLESTRPLAVWTPGSCGTAVSHQPVQ